MVDAAIEEIGPVRERPVARFHTEKALEQLPGVIELAEEALTMAQQAEGDDAAVAAVLPRLARPPTRAWSDGPLQRHLRDEVLPRSEGEGRLGPRFRREMRHTMRSDALTPERILEQADATTGPSVPRWSARHRAVADLVPGTERPVDEHSWCAGSLTQSRPTIRSPRSCSISAERSSSGSRRSAASTT